MAASVSRRGLYSRKLSEAPPRYMGKVYGRGQTIFENFLVSEAPSRNSAKTLSNGA